MGDQAGDSQGSNVTMTTAAGLRFPCPKNFSGKDEDWDLFQYKFRAYMCLANVKFKEIFELAQSAGINAVDLDLEADEYELLAHQLQQRKLFNDKRSLRMEQSLGDFSSIGTVRLPDQKLRAA